MNRKKLEKKKKHLPNQMIAQIILPYIPESDESDSSDSGENMDEVIIEDFEKEFFQTDL